MTNTNNIILATTGQTATVLTFPDALFDGVQTAWEDMINKKKQEDTPCERGIIAKYS
jgi:hypothetical protein